MTRLPDTIEAAVEEQVAKLMSEARPHDPALDRPATEAEKRSLERLMAVTPSRRTDTPEATVTEIADLPLARIEDYRRDVAEIARCQREAHTRGAYRMVD